MLVDARIVAVTLDDQGTLAPPAGVAGWYAAAGWPKPGQGGTAIIVGHVNTVAGPDTFADLTAARPLDRITVFYPHGAEVRFVVHKVSSVSKQRLPSVDSIWDASARRPLLRLITCDPASPLAGGHYSDNWVVWADRTTPRSSVRSGTG